MSVAKTVHASAREQLRVTLQGRGFAPSQVDRRVLIFSHVTKPLIVLLAGVVSSLVTPAVHPLYHHQHQVILKGCVQRHVRAHCSGSESQIAAGTLYPVTVNGLSASCEGITPSQLANCYLSDSLSLRT